MPNPTIVSAALNDKDLRDSITKLVEDYKNSLNDMKTATTNAVKDIQETIKSIGSTKVDFSGTLDGLEKAKKKMTSAASGGGTTTPAKDGYADNTIGALEESIRLEKEKRREMELGSSELRKQNQIIHEQQNQLKDETKSIATKRLENALKMPSNDIDEANKKLRVLEILQRRYGDTTELSVTEQKKLAGAIGQTQKAINTLNSKRPRSIKEVLGMDASSIDAIQQKLKAISNLRMNINADAHPRVIAMLNQQYDELHRKQLRLMGQNGDLIRSNRTLASTFGYIRNRIIYAFTLGTLTQFFKDVRNIRAEYEMLDRSLGILVGDFEKGTQIFNELNQMALQSPFTLIELGTAAKQLTAYNFAADEVVDTTRRLADISAALGVPMERLTYNLGQIKAQGALTARDARDFANAGLAIVPMLADMYTKQKAFGKEMTTTADVYDMMSKKMVSYGDVLSVLQKVTDEGGKFFNFQARQADTLKVQIANLSLAYNNMMNEIGADNQGLLSGSIRMVRSLFENWQKVTAVIKQLILTFGAYKAIVLLATLYTGRMVNGQIVGGWANYVKSIKSATGAMATFNAVTKLNPLGFLAAALASVAGYFLLFRDNVQEVSQEVEMFGESASKTLKKIDTLKKILDGTSDTSSTYKKTLSELSGVMHEYGIELDAEKANRDEINNATEQTIQLIKEEAAERQRANNIAKGEENYNKGIKDAKDAFYSEISDISDLTDIGGQTKKFRKELEDNAQAISDVVATIVEDNISLVVGKSGDEATKGMLEIQEKVSGAMSSMGISSKATKYLLYNTDILRDLIIQTRKVSEEQINYNNSIDSYYNNSKKLTESTMTFTQKVEANSRALQNNTNDALSLYNKIYDIVKIAQQNHTINFDLKLTADNPPKWMLDKSLPELQRLAQRFAAVAQSGGHIEGYDREGTYQQALRYASAARQKQETEERAARMKDNNKTKKERDAILDTIKEEISLTKKLQSEYDKLTSKGASHADAIKDIEKRYTNTIKLLDVDLGKFNLPKFDTSIITGKDPNKQLEYFKNLRDILESKGLLNLDRSKVLDATIQELDVSAKTYNLDKITKGLNNELDRLKEEYELAVALDADPELGSMFADWMGINLDDLPKTAEEAAKKAQEYIDKILADNNSSEKIDISSLMDKKAFDSWVESSGHNLEDGLVKAVSAFRSYLHKVNVDETKNQAQEWNKLLEKYAEYEYKISEIHKNAQRERDIATKKGAGGDVIQAINNKEKRDVARVDFEEFQKSAYWITATGNLTSLTNSALQMLIDKIEQYKLSAKELDAKQILRINKVLASLRKQVRTNNPFSELSNAMEEAATNAGVFLQDIEDVNDKIQALTKKQEENGGFLDEKDQAALDKYKKKFKELQKAMEEASHISFAQVNNSMGAYFDRARELSQSFVSIADAIGDEKLSKAASVIDDFMGNIQAAQKGAETWGGWWGAIIGGVSDGLPKIIKYLNGDNGITNSIKHSEVYLKRLQNTYNELERDIEKSYGTEALGAQKLQIANKQAQLEETKRQLELERSRKKKNQDLEKIAELENQVSELEDEISTATKKIVEDLMGIGNATDFAENLVSSMIDAFKRGEDYMGTYKDSFDDMIDAMIAKAIVGRLIGQKIEELFTAVQNTALERAENDVDVINAEQRLNELQEKVKFLQKLHDEDSVGMSESEYQSVLAEGRKQIEEAKKEYEKLYSQAATPTPEDVDMVRDMAGDWSTGVKELFEEYMKAFGIAFGQDSEQNQLSALQQGIQGITETTAGALEAYMNGVSQQVYYQSDLLTQIRDAVVLFNTDVQVAAMGQILLQLQNSYLVQTAIQNILNGWSSPNGLAVRVEMA